MKEEILLNLNNPGQLERLYRNDKSNFRRAFTAIYPEVKDNTLAGFWYERLNFSKDEISWGSTKDLWLVVAGCVVAGLIAQLPAMFNIDEEFFYPRNIGFIIFPLLTAYFAWKNNVSTGRIVIISLISLAGLIFINVLPDNDKSDTLILSCIHLLLCLWSLSGLAFSAEKANPVEGRLNYLSYNGDLVVMTTLIVISGAILSGMTIGLFSLIGFNIEEFYFRNVVISLLPSAPLLGTYLIRTNPQLVGRVSPVIAKIFSPLVLVMLIIYLGAMIYSGKDPYNDRDFLIIFNALLIGVMAIIFFSVSETSRSSKKPMGIWILFLLSAVTIIVNGIALSAILFRISTMGITPNRIAVLGGNVLILVNLVMVTSQLFKTIFKKTDIAGARKAIAVFMPVYFLWAAFVTFLLPFLFKFS